jgi:hypothetical protein
MGVIQKGRSFRYIYYWHLEFLSNVNIINTKVLHTQAYVTFADSG